jgi:glutathione peroxidase
MTLHELTAKAIDGTEQALSAYRGKVLLVVNVASRCGYTSQYSGLERLWQSRRDDGLLVLGFPCNQFGAQEPGTEAEIQSFCSTKYGVTFPLFSKVEVNGGGRHPVYQALTSATTGPIGPGDISWNFEKFLVGRSGEVLARFAPATKPDASELTAAIDRALAG